MRQCAWHRRRPLSGQDAAYVKEEEAVEEMAREQTRQEVAEALKSEEAVYQMLDKYDLPQTPAFLKRYFGNA